MSRKIKYIESFEEVIEIHLKTIEISGGGIDGIINPNYIQMCLSHIQDDDYYPTFEDKLTHLVFVANKSHSFLDGNKRLAIALGMKFLINNGYMFVVQRFAERVSKDLLHEIIFSIINEEDYSEELKMKILKAYESET